MPVVVGGIVDQHPEPAIVRTGLSKGDTKGNEIGQINCDIACPCAQLANQRMPRGRVDIKDDNQRALSVKLRHAIRRLLWA